MIVILALDYDITYIQQQTYGQLNRKCWRKHRRSHRPTTWGQRKSWAVAIAQLGRLGRLSFFSPRVGHVLSSSLQCAGLSSSHSKVCHLIDLVYSLPGYSTTHRHVVPTSTLSFQTDRHLPQHSGGPLSTAMENDAASAAEWHAQRNRQAQMRGFATTHEGRQTPSGAWRSGHC